MIDSCQVVVVVVVERGAAANKPKRGEWGKERWWPGVVLLVLAVVLDRLSRRGVVEWSRKDKGWESCRKWKVKRRREEREREREQARATRFMVRYSHCVITKIRG